MLLGGLSFSNLNYLKIADTEQTTKDTDKFAWEIIEDKNGECTIEFYVVHRKYVGSATTHKEAFEMAKQAIEARFGNLESMLD